MHTWDRTAGGPRTYRLDRMRSARLTEEEFEPRAGFDPNYLREPRTAKLWHSPVVARWKLERGARLLTDKAAISDLPYKTDEWLLSEVLGDGGETVVLEPAEARAMVATRAKALQRSSASARAGSGRQHEPERRPLAGARLHLRPAPVRERDGAHDREAEPRPGSALRRADARLEDAEELVGRHALPLVGDLDHDLARVLHAP